MVGEKGGDRLEGGLGVMVVKGVVGGMVEMCWGVEEGLVGGVVGGKVEVVGERGFVVVGGRVIEVIEEGW